MFLAQQFNPLLASYSLSITGNVSVKQQRFRNFVGVRVQI